MGMTYTSLMTLYTRISLFYLINCVLNGVLTCVELKKCAGETSPSSRFAFCYVGWWVYLCSDTSIAVWQRFALSYRDKTHLWMTLYNSTLPYETTLYFILVSYFFSWCPSPNLSFVDIWNTSTVGTGRRCQCE